jgi:endogenous inhibitor of DNA gyrase (YacG/DUF329 family)
MSHVPEVGRLVCRKAWPFCSQRCRLVDLGQWFAEEHSISSPLRPEHLEQYADLPAGEQLDHPDPE